MRKQNFGMNEHKIKLENLSQLEIKICRLNSIVRISNPNLTKLIIKI